MQGININLIPKEVEINIKELDGDSVDLNLAELHEVQGQFEKRVISSPDEYSFDKNTKTSILEAFTEGALKNIIALSTEKIRLYKVTEDSIELLSCSSLPHALPETSWENLCILNGSNCSVQVFYSSEEKNQCMSLKFAY